MVAMNEPTSQNTEQLLNTLTSGGNPYEQLFAPLMPVLSLLFVVSIIATVVIVIFFIVNTIQKQRQHSAIMRIDKNLQRLVDDKFGKAEEHKQTVTPEEPAIRNQANETV